MTGSAALGGGLLLLVASPLYVVAGTAPSLGDAAAFTDYVARHSAIAATTKLVDGVYVTAVLVFVSGLRGLIRRTCPYDPWIADLAFGAGLLHAGVVLLGDVLGAAAAMDAMQAPDRSAVRALREASLLAFGGLGFLMTAVFLAAAGFAVLRSSAGAPPSTRTTSRVIGWAAAVLAVVNVAAIPTVYRGSDYLEVVIDGGNATMGAYSYISAIAGLLYCVWLIAVGIAVLTGKIMPAGGAQAMSENQGQSPAA